MRRMLRVVFALALGAAVIPPAAASPMDPVPVSSLLGGEPQAVVVQGNYAYCAALGGLSVVDISDPANPQLAGACDSPGEAWDVAISGHYACVANYAYPFNGLLIVDISDPTHPVQASTLESHGYPSGVTIYDHYALLALTGYPAGMEIIDISDPLQPVSLSTCWITGGAGVGYSPKLGISGHYAYLATQGSGLTVIDISDPAQPVEAGLYEAHHMLGDVAIRGDLAYVAAWTGPGPSDWEQGGLLILDITQAAAPAEVAFVPEAIQPTDVFVSDDRYAFIADQEYGLRVFDVWDPARAISLGTYNTPGRALGSVTVGSLAYLADGGGGLRVLDISNPASPSLVGLFRPPADGWSSAAAGDVLYMSDSLPGLRLADISNPAAPALLPSLALPGYACDIAIAGSHAYVADGDSGLQVLDLSDPRAPVAVGSLATPQFAQSIAVSGHYAYLGDQSGTFRVIDVADPAHPTEVGSNYTGNLPFQIALSGGYAYAATGGLSVIQVSQPSNSVVVGYLPLESCQGVAVSGDLAYVADYQLGLASVDISDPAQPRLLAVCQPTGSAESITVYGSYAYVGDRQYGLRVVGLTDPAEPVWAGSYPAFGSPTPGHVTAYGDRLYVGEEGWGLEVLRLPTTFSDLPLDHWALDAVERCHIAGIVSGYPDGSYRPNTTVTRDQMAAYISRALAGGDDLVPSGPAQPSFRDVGTSHWAYKHIEYAAASNIVQGYPDVTYRPAEPVDRGQMAVFIARSIVTPTGDIGLKDYVPPASPTFADVPSSFWSYKYVEYIAQESTGIAHGYPDGLYHPEYQCTRDQMAVYVTRAFGLQY